MPLLTLNLSCENVNYPARKHFEKTNIVLFKMFSRWFFANEKNQYHIYSFET